MSQTAAAYVHVGPWINWSHGPILGSTLTLSERDGGLLTAFLGIFVTAAGASCWKIMSYALHQHRSPRYPQDGIHHQQQAILRNTETPIGASFELARLIWSWRKHALRSFTQTLPLVALAIFNFVLFGTYIVERIFFIAHSTYGARHTRRARGRFRSLGVSLHCRRRLHKAALTPKLRRARRRLLLGSHQSSRK